MTNSALINAKTVREQLINERDSLQQRLELVKKRLDIVDEFLHNYEAFADGTLLKDLDSENIQRTKSESAHRRVRNSSKEQVAEAARKIIQAVGAPVPRRQLLSLLDEEGLIIEGEDREKVLSTMLWRMRDKVVSFKRTGYWLAEIPYPPLNYDPERYFQQLEDVAAEMASEAGG